MQNDSVDSWWGGTSFLPLPPDWPWGRRLTTHLYLAPKLRMHRAIPFLFLYVFMPWYLVKSKDNFFSTLQKYVTCKINDQVSYRLDDRGSRVQFLAGVRNFSLNHCIQNGSEAHSASYPMGTGDSFPVGNVARV